VSPIPPRARVSVDTITTARSLAKGSIPIPFVSSDLRSDGASPRRVDNMASDSEALTARQQLTAEEIKARTAMTDEAFEALLGRVPPDLHAPVPASLSPYLRDPRVLSDEAYREWLRKLSSCTSGD
jgi:hypothetical protein